MAFLVVIVEVSQIISFLLPQQWPTCLVRLSWTVLEIGGRCPYNCCFMGCCFQDLFNTARSTLLQLPSSFFSIRFVSVHLVHPYNRIDTTSPWKKSRFILSDSLDFPIINNLSIVAHTFARRILVLFSIDETQLPRYMNWSSTFKSKPLIRPYPTPDNVHLGVMIIKK